MKPHHLRHVSRSLLLTAALVGGAGVAGGVFLAGRPGLWSGLLGAVIVLLLAGLEVMALRVVARKPELAMAGIMGAFLGKAIVMLGALLVSRAFSTLHPAVLFLTLTAGILVSLGVEVYTITRIRPTVEVPPRTSGPQNTA